MITHELNRLRKSGKSDSSHGAVLRVATQPYPLGGRKAQTMISQLMEANYVRK
jgi:hypothetical protein